MSISTCSDASVKSCAASPNSTEPLTAQWEQRIGDEVRTVNPVDLDPDDLIAAEPFRAVTSSKRSRNIVVAVWSVTGQCVRSLESGLEHDLHRYLDQPRVSRAVLPQPFRISIATGSHVPDFAQLGLDGTVTIWDCRPESKIDARARSTFEWTAQAADAVGWRYEVFTGMTAIERQNRMFCNGYRVTTTGRGRLLRPWIPENTPRVLAAAAAPTTMEALYALDDGSGGVIATVWHLISRNDLVVDMCSEITPATVVVAA